MSVTVQQTRIFKYGALVLDDPGADMSLNEVKEFYGEVYPELTQSNIEGPEITDEGLVYEFRKTVGTKGYQDMVGISDIAWRKAKVEHNESVPRVTALMQDAAKILIESEPDGSDTFFAPAEMQEVI